MPEVKVPGHLHPSGQGCLTRSAADCISANVRLQEGGDIPSLMQGIMQENASILLLSASFPLDFLQKMLQT